MTSHSSLSSEQALDDYFSALLEESVEEEEVKDISSNIDGPIESDDCSMQPMLQSIDETSYYKPPSEDIEIPNLEDVERLLEQMETSNPVAELELEDILEQNTVDLSHTQIEIEEEIQDWDIPEFEEHQVVEAEVDVVTQSEVVTEIVEPDSTNKVVLEDETLLESKLETKVSGNGLDNWQSTIRENDFQVLYFDVNSVTFAVPLDELGGIHRIAELNHLIGRPTWYLGLQTSRESQLDVVDTAKWVMPEKLKDESHQEGYQYIVMLGESMWGLASSELKGTESLNPLMVRWRETAGKRPWLAGMVKEKMCALIHVEALIAMLNAGLDVKALDN